MCRGGSIYYFLEESIEQFEIVEITTFRSSERTDIWRGFRLIDFLSEHNLSQSPVIEFTATDRYIIRLTYQQIIEFDPIIAIERNGEPLFFDQFRLVSSKMPEMFWIAKISNIKAIENVERIEPIKIYPYHTILNKIRLRNIPDPFEKTQGFRMVDIVSQITDSPHAQVRFITRDYLEQILSLEEYLLSANLIVSEDGNFSIRCANMPVGMWFRDIMFIETEGKNIFFYRNVNLDTNKLYLQFIEKLSKKKRTMYIGDTMIEVANWNDINWEEIDYIK
jgi:hypothetical protein